MLTWKDVLNQSKAVFSQFGESKWIPYAKKNVELPRRDTDELKNSGIGKTMLLCAMGESLEANIDVIKKYRDRVDICTCDKGFGVLYEYGIKADYVMVCDCNILFHHIESHIDATHGVKLLATPYANPTYTRTWNGDRYFFINVDAINSEKIFIDIFGKLRLMPAGSNVSNAMLIFFSGADNDMQNLNWANYDKYLLVGYDYSWRPNGSYYAWKNPMPKRYYMHHRTLRDINGDMVYTSENLKFSAQWMQMYITRFNLPAINCSDRGILDVPFRDTLENQLSKINPNPELIENTREHYFMLQNTAMIHKQSENIFKKIRGERYGNWKLF